MPDASVVAAMEHYSKSSSIDRASTNCPVGPVLAGPIFHEINKNKIYREKSIPMIALWCPAFSKAWLTFSCLKHNIVTFLVIYSLYLLKDLVEV